MRSRLRDRQNVYFATFTETLDGIDTIKTWSAPIKKKMVVSATSGTPDEIAAGIVPNYDRYLTNYDRSFQPTEGMSLWIDVEPELDEEGNLVIGENETDPTVSPDYILVKILDTKKGTVARYGIEKVGGVYSGINGKKDN